MSIVDIIEDDDMTLCVRIEFFEGGGALLQVHWSFLKDVHQWQPFRHAEARSAIVHNAVSSNMFCSYFIHTATAQEKINVHKYNNTFIKQRSTQTTKSI